MLDRRLTAEPGIVEVTFRLPLEVGAEVVHVVGDFNEWSRDADPLRRDEHGHSITLRLRSGQRYQFRYLLDGHLWENDWAADDYVGNEFGGENSMLDLTGEVRSDAGTPLARAEEAFEDALAVDTLVSESQQAADAMANLHPVTGDGAEAGSTSIASQVPPAAEAPSTDEGAEQTSSEQPSSEQPSSEQPSSEGTSSKQASSGRAASKGTSAKGTSSKGKGPKESSKRKGSKESAKRKGSKESKGTTRGSSSATKGGNGEGPTKAELMEEAKRLDVAGRSKMNKGELERAVAAARKG